MKESLYLKMQRKIRGMELFQEITKEFIEKMRIQPVGIAAQLPTAEECKEIATGKIEDFFESKSEYALYLIQLAALEEAADSLKKITGYSGYIDEIYLPITSSFTVENHQGTVIGKELLKASLIREQMQKQSSEKYYLAENYEVETALEEEINRMVRESMYQRVYVAGKLEISTEVYQIPESNQGKKMEYFFKTGM